MYRLETSHVAEATRVGETGPSLRAIRLSVDCELPELCRRRLWQPLFALFFLFLLVSARDSRPVFAQETVILTLVERTDTFRFMPPSSDPAGLVYLPHSNRLLLSDSEINEIDNIFGDANLFEVDLSGTLLSTALTLDFSDEPTGLTFNALNGHFFVSDDDAKEVVEIFPGSDGVIGTADDFLRSLDTASFGCGDPEDLAFDPVSGHLFIVDGDGAEVYEVDPGENGFFDGVPLRGGDDLVTSFDLEEFGGVDPEGLDVDVANGTLLVVESTTNGRILELTPGGVLLRVFDTSDASVKTPAGVTVAPGSTDPGRRSFYVVDRARDGQNDGRIHEFSLPAVPVATITRFVPDRGTAGTEVVLSGNNFTGATQVLFDETSTPFTVISDGEIRVSVPEAVESGRLAVLNAQGPAYSPGVFVVLTPPVITGLTPPYAGEGEWFRVRGGGLSETTGLTIGGLPVDEWVVDSETQLSVRVPSGVIGGVVEVSTTLGSAVSPGDFLLLPSLIILPSDDAHVRSNNADTNFGDNDRLRVKDGSSKFRTYLKFEVVGGGVVQSARLRLFATGASFDGGRLFLVSNDFEGTSTPWDQDTLTWNNAPALGGAPEAEVGTTFLMRWVEVDVTHLVSGDGTYSFGLSGTDPVGLFYGSREGDEAPELVIVRGDTVDSDGDGVPDRLDNCPYFVNVEQTDQDENGVGDACESEVLFVRGDVDNNGFLDIVDSIFALFAMFNGSPSPPCWKAVDSNDDGTPDVSDILTSLRALFQHGEPLPAPHSDCGADPSPDSLSCEAFFCF